jgi:predicted XRE-type DNA-binding protein
MTKSVITPASENIFEDLGYSLQEAEYLIIRADLMLKIRSIIQSQGWSLEQAAEQFEASSDRIQALLNGKIGEFTIEQLITFLTRAGMKVRLEILPSAA